MSLVVGATVNTFGVDGPPEARGVLHTAQRIEELGYDSVWMGDRLLFHVPLYEGLVIMSAVAAVTERVRVGSGVLLGLLRHPAWLAKSLATIDHVSGGRLIAGFGVGGEYPAVFVERVDFASSPGHGEARNRHCDPHSTGPELVVTPLAVLDFDDTGSMRLVSVHGGHTVDEVRERTGFELATVADVAETPEPDAEELRLLREMIDPHGTLAALLD